MEHTEPFIPSRRRQAKVHLRDAAKSSLASPEEHYSVQAAIAEALVDLVEAIKIQNTLLVEIAAKAIMHAEGQD